ncbi:proprotein convertase subtilisin/kexin type 5-like [Chironomus tepperi]|uniref:proprotein convertase subtilisin/kexin type 5-like n=1 Tax=Chironomus tepperi TaxID=113505 RepID=UPI00391F80C6
MKNVEYLVIVLVSISLYADTNGETCDALNSVNCLNDTNQVIVASAVRISNRICYLCYGAECLDVAENEAAEVECESSCYIGIDENGLITRGCASDYGDTKGCSKDENSINQCFTCDNDYCNAILYPIKGRLQCHTCLDEFCQPSNDDVVYCTRYHPDEKCVTIYSPDVDAVETRGCISDVDSLNECTSNSTNCLMCSTDNCNNDTSKTQKFSCIGCNSIDEPACIGDNFETVKRCTSNECFTRTALVSSPTNSGYDQYLERGCLADITECNNSICKSCTGTNCNNAIFPEDRMSCKFCVGDSCSNGPLKDKICTNYINNEGCITFFGTNNQVIYRDCYDDVPYETQVICDDPNNIECTKCSGSLCNTVIKRRGNKCFQCMGIDCFHPTIGDIVDCLSECFIGVNENGETVRGCANNLDATSLCGNSTSSCMKCNDDLCNGIVYPEHNRLSCLSCSGGDCLNIDSSKYCEVFGTHETCVTVFNSLNQTTERGCLSTLSSAQYCTNNQAYCIQCQFDNCNVQTSPDQTNYCVSCNSKFDSDCVTNPKSSSVIGCKGKCYSRFAVNDNEIIERGCSDSIGSYVECEGERCNSVNFPSNRLTCFKCIGSDCDVSDLDMMKEPCLTYIANDTACLTIFNEGNVNWVDYSKVVFKGCHSDVSKETQTLCDDSNDISCTKCNGNNCNTARERRGTKCIQCVGLDCLSSGYPANVVDCQTGGCYVGVDINGLTHKGCASSYQNISSCSVNVDTEASKTCLICDKDFCNAIVYPLENRLICMNCYGTACDEISIDEKYCEQLSPNERCVSIFNADDKITERGCLSTVESSAMCNQNSTNCLKCNTNRCNLQNSRDEKHFCVSCNSMTDPTCTSINSSPNTKACTTNQCYSRLIPAENNWNYIEKGCISDLPSNNPVCTNCTTCDGSLCNNIVYPVNLISCRHCIGDECKTSTVTKRCSLFSQQKQGCITIFADRQDVIYRGCYSDAAIGTQDVCDDFTNIACTKCTSGSNCNTDQSRRGFKCYKCSGSDCFVPRHPSDVIDCIANCYVGLNSYGENVRGCYASYSNRTCGTDEDSRYQCISCQDDFCNGIMYPVTNRLSCHICHDSNNCQIVSDDNINYCPNHGQQEKCVSVFNADNQVIERGCSSSLNNNLYCSQNYKNCIECGTAGCNNITSVSSKMCAVCDSISNKDCVLNPKAVPTKYCNRGCYTRLMNGDLYRGCLEDLNNSTCTDATNCVSCADFDKCNVINYPNNRMECLTCNNSTDCIHPTKMSCIRHRANEACVTIFNGYQVYKKGCYADQSTTDQTVCSANNNTCLTCSTSNCNTNNVRPDESCIVCKSDINPQCAQKPHELSAERCLLPSDGECYAKISDGSTQRGCKGSLTSTDINNCRNNSISSECLISSGQGSNNKLIPIKRLNCYYCDSAKDENCGKEQTNLNETLPCKSYKSPENCVKITYSDGRVVRGCLADFSTDTCSYGHCESCPSDKITDGCNSSFANNISASIVLLVISILAFIMVK